MKTVLLNGAVKSNESDDMTQRDPERLEICAKRSKMSFLFRKKYNLIYLGKSN